MKNLYFRLLSLQAECYRRGHRRWAAALGERLRAMHADNPSLKSL